jgi:hypothetical protein
MGKRGRGTERGSGGRGNEKRKTKYIELKVDKDCFLGLLLHKALFRSERGSPTKPLLPLSPLEVLSLQPVYARGRQAGFRLAENPTFILSLGGSANNISS